MAKTTRKATTKRRVKKNVEHGQALPTRKQIFTVNRSTFVNKKAREQFQLCTFKRILDIYSSTPKTIDALMKLELPSGVEVEIKV